MIACWWCFWWGEELLRERSVWFLDRGNQVRQRARRVYKRKKSFLAAVVLQSPSCSNTDIGLYIRFNWSENKAIRDRFERWTSAIRKFIEILYFENERLRPEGNGYYKTSFDTENEKGEKSYTFGIRYDIGSELYPLSERWWMKDFQEEYIEYASKLDKKL